MMRLSFLRLNAKKAARLRKLISSHGPKAPIVVPCMDHAKKDVLKLKVASATDDEKPQLYDLKRAIKKEMKPLFDNMPAADIPVWKEGETPAAALKISNSEPVDPSTKYLFQRPSVEALAKNIEFEGTDIYDTFRGQHLFITGGTGFLGKVFLYKILKEFPDVGSITLLTFRGKKSPPTVPEQLQEEVFSSECFAPLREVVGEEELQRRFAKIKGVNGDLCADGFGMSPQEYDEICAKTNIVMHLAATVNFDERLDRSVKINTLGTLRAVMLAKSCPNIKACIHCSTCYVNWKRHGGVVEEKVFPLEFDVEAMTKYILSVPETKIADVSSKLLKKYNFPNTYTFTKCMAEHIAMKYKGHVPFAVVRPAIIGSSWKEPATGWVDVLTASGVLFLLCTLGAVHELHVHGHQVVDLVPVDFVVNMGLKVVHHVASRHAQYLLECAKTPNKLPPLPESDVFHLGVSASYNTFEWWVAQENIMAVWKDKPHPRAEGRKLYLNFYDSDSAYRRAFFWKRTVPFTFLKMLSILRVPPFHNEAGRKKIAKMEKGLKTAQILNNTFAPFVNHYWVYDNSNVRDKLETRLSPKAQLAFRADPIEVDWPLYVQAYNVGVYKYIVKDSAGKEMPEARPPSGPGTLSGCDQFDRALRKV